MKTRYFCSFAHVIVTCVNLRHVGCLLSTKKVKSIKECCRLSLKDDPSVPDSLESISCQKQANAKILRRQEELLNS